MRRTASPFSPRMLVGLLAATLLLVPAAAAQPEQVHVSWSGERNVGVAWVRPGDVRGSSGDAVRVLGGGLSPDRDVGASILSYIGPGVTVHKAEVPLPGGAPFSYQVGSDAEGWSQVFTLPEDPADGEPWRFVAYGDHGVGAASNASALLVPTVAARRPHAVLHLGDIAYADGSPAVWDEWFRMVEPLASSTRYMATPGNHEHEGYHVASGPSPDQAAFAGSAIDPYEQFRERFHLPGGGLRYSFDVGPVHVVAINSEDLCVTQPATYAVPWRVSPACAAESQAVPTDGDRSLPPNQELLDWMEADLAAHADAPWTFVMLHRPVYSAGGYSGEPVLREHFVPVFERYGVDLVLSGHDHNYQRSFPLRGGSPVTATTHAFARDEAPIYIVSGGAGEGYYTLAEPSPAWTAARTTAFHFLALDVWPGGLRLAAVDTMTGETLDSFTVGQVPPGATDAAEDGGAGRGTPLPVAVAVAALGLGLAVRRLTGTRRS